MIYIGIDPGLTGAIAAVHVIDRTEILSRVEDMPFKASRESGEKGKSKRTVNKRVDGLQLSNMLEKMCEGADGAGGRARVYIEEVWSNPNQGVSSMFSFGFSYGVAVGVVEGMGFEPVLVRPGKWKKVFGLIGGEKVDSIPTAVGMYPELADRLARKKDDGRADALLIATYAAVQGGDFVLPP